MKRTLATLIGCFPLAAAADVDFAEPVRIGNSLTPSKAWLYVENPTDLVKHETMLVKGTRNSSGGGERSTILFENPDGALRAMFNSEGQYYTNGWMTISGTFHSTRNAMGEISIVSGHPHQGTPYMFGIYSDIQGPAAMVRGSGYGDSHLLMGIDGQNNVRLGIEEDGTLRWGPGPERSDLDVRLERYVTGSGDSALRMTTAFGNEINLAQQPSVQPPSGGAVIDQEARQKIGELIDLLTAMGFMKGTMASMPAVPSWLLLAMSVAIVRSGRRPQQATKTRCPEREGEETT